MSQALDPVRAFFSRINLICAITGAALLFGIAAIVCFEVLGRALGASSQLWVIEVSEYALLFITFLGAPYLLELNRHVIIDLLINGLTGTLSVAVIPLDPPVPYPPEHRGLRAGQLFSHSQPILE